MVGVLSGKMPTHCGRITLGRNDGMVVNKKAHKSPERVIQETPRGRTNGYRLWGRARSVGKAEPLIGVFANTGAERWTMLVQSNRGDRRKNAREYAFS